ncbi:MAG: hypothetical protein JJ872_02420 [Marivivens sp.]|jgi:hypothetical protein|nr:hypothetical protein [Marivivens sp.]
MKKLALAALFIGVASAAVAGGMAAPVIEMDPVVIEEATSSSDAGLIIPLILIALIAAAMI